MKTRNARPRSPEQEADEAALSDAIVDWAGSADRSFDMPQQNWLLKFRHAALECAYLQVEYERNHKLVLLGTGLAMLIMTAFLWIDPLISPPQSLQIIKTMRIYVGIPSTVAAFLGALLIKRARLWIPWISALITLNVGIILVPLLEVGSPVFGFLSAGMWDMMIPTFFLFGLPLRWAMVVSLVHCVAYSVGAHQVGIDLPTYLDRVLVTTVIVFVFSAFATYRYERATRQQFVTQRASHLASTQRLAAEADKRRWLEVIAAFLGHELHNAMTGIGTSIVLAGQASDASLAAPYLARARDSVAYMRRLLTQVADASSLESALMQQTFETVDLSTLVRERVEDLRQDHPGRVFDTRLAPQAQVYGHADSLVQLLDKLVNNAIEHGDPAQPIRIALQVLPGVCQLVVSNRGDALPADVEPLFQPFVTHKPGPAFGEHLGLGLFVVRTIAAHHRGTARAEPLPDGAAGARFTVELPTATP